MHAECEESSNIYKMYVMLYEIANRILYTNMAQMMRLVLVNGHFCCLRKMTRTDDGGKKIINFFQLTQ